MKLVYTLCLTLCALVTHEASAFTRSTSIIVNKSQVGVGVSPTAISFRRTRDDKTITKLPRIEAHKSQPSIRRIQRVGSLVWGRMDTMKSAGFYRDKSLVPMQMGFKSNIGVFVGLFMWKWYRARFITKIPVWDRQPQWNMVVTSPEQEKNLHAYSCKKCGATIFIARHREWFFQGGNTRCTNCDATGKDNFIDIRGEIIDSIDDDYFDYESPLDFVSAAERRRLVKQAGGDEEKAKQLAIDNAMQNDKEQINVEETSSSSSGITSGETAPTPERATAAKKSEPDVFDELDMDL